MPKAHSQTGRTAEGRANPLSPWRKAPRQARSAATVDAIFEATVQVLLAEGTARLTTTRVAARAGVSIGTMYQYFPNKRALLLALFDRHMGSVVDAVEAACVVSHGEPLTEIAQALVAAFMAMVQSRPQESQAAFSLTGEPENAALLRIVTDRIACAVGEVLTNAADASFEHPADVAMTLTSAMAGAARSLIEHGLAPARVTAQGRQLVLMLKGYLEAAKTN